jgi:sulfotransferase
MIFFNSSMPRSMSTLLQCVLNQNPEIEATPTDPVLEYLYGARINFTEVKEVKAINPELALKNWKGFCWGGLDGYTKAYTNKPNICIKTRGGSIHYKWFESFMPYKPKMICMVRNLKSIFSSMEKIFRKNYEYHQPIQDHSKMIGTSTIKRVDVWLNSPPVGLALERLNQVFLEKNNNNILFIKAEDFTLQPEIETRKIYNYLNLEYYEHDFNNVEQTVKEDDAVYGLNTSIHTIKKSIKPVKEDYEEILGNNVCNLIDSNFAWYQKLFNYV